MPARKSVVEKMNENKGRVFYVCSMPQFKQCKFFMVRSDLFLHVIDLESYFLSSLVSNSPLVVMS